MSEVRYAVEFELATDPTVSMRVINEWICRAIHDAVHGHTAQDGEVGVGAFVDRLVSLNVRHRKDDA